MIYEFIHTGINARINKHTDDGITEINKKKIDFHFVYPTYIVGSHFKFNNKKTKLRIKLKDEYLNVDGFVVELQIVTKQLLPC